MWYCCCMFVYTRRCDLFRFVLTNHEHTIVLKYKHGKRVRAPTTTTNCSFSVSSVKCITLYVSTFHQQHSICSLRLEKKSRATKICVLCIIYRTWNECVIGRLLPRLLNVQIMHLLVHQVHLDKWECAIWDDTMILK